MIFKSLRFGGIDTKGFDVFISGDAVYNSPSRDVEMFEIPGRNGAFALDKGRFSNIQLSYPSGIGTKNEAEFREKIEGLRNALSSKVGYQRLEDDYHGEEFRMAVYKGGLDVNPTMLKAGQFDIVFDCKPQRFLKSGEIEQSVTSGDTITNPTSFESHPLLLVDGYGDININDDVISIQQGAMMGRTILNMSPSTRFVPVSNGARYFLDLESANLNDVSLNGDNIRLGTSRLNVYYESANEIYVVRNISYQSGSEHRLYRGLNWNNNLLQIDLEVLFADFVKGTASQMVSSSGTLTFDLVTWQGYEQVTTSESLTLREDVSYDGDKTFTIRITVTSSTNLTPSNKGNFVGSLGESYVQSTKSALGQLYIDLDIGECYRIENGQIISINTATILPADLPTLKPGDNVITYDNTFTSFKITPRYWRV